MSRLYRQVASVLRDRIVCGAYAANTRLPAERELVAEFGVSRTTVREALLALEITGLVKIRTGSGVTVLDAPRSSTTSQIDLDAGPFELLEARRTIESEIAGAAARAIDDVALARLRRCLEEMARENAAGSGNEDPDYVFHMTIARATGNSVYESVVEHLWRLRDSSPMLISIRQKARQRGIAPIVSQHREILEALERRDPRLAYAAMHAHLTWVIGALLESTDAEPCAGPRTTRTRRSDP